MDSRRDERDPLFRYEEPIFAREELLKISHVPEPDRIVGRDQHMQRVAEALNPAVFGREPDDLLVFGKTGTGKSLTTRSVTDRVVVEAERDDHVVHSAFIDCGEQNTETAVVKNIAKAINDPELSETTVPERGLGTGDYYNRLWTILESCTDVAIVILDEIDLLEDDEVLRKLSRAGENRNLADAALGIVGISNKIDFPSDLGERVKSSFSPDDIVFQPYDADQLVDILEHRRDAFHDGVLEDGVINLTAALAAREHGDARKAIDILRNAGSIATNAGDERVTETHVRRAKEKTEADRFAELIDGAPIQTKVILAALTRLSATHADDEFATKRVFSAYTRLADELDLERLSERRVTEILKEQDFLNVIRSEKHSRGRGRGVFSKHRLLEDPDVVRRVISRDDALTPVL
ncbi:AAA family ATPase [Halarchaeum sp. CBA1220]|uniref:Cdc6/Cdc18 family protein n=1 Tax=Halarchaeum sp. CBA1220 TaxID=1853682 RepID=UPI000F3A8536|nr:orc1/cdc6 family replication initiation protein [Halarchaeum sp. CBA1220]QLC32946.1 AAA family ATPase [Halarchaeum sp. CBA1220]